MNKLFLSSALVALISITYTPISSAGLFDGLSSGLAAVFDTSKKKLDIYNQSTDKALVDHFYHLSEDGKEEGLNREFAEKATEFKFLQLTQSTITFNKPMFRALNFPDLMAQYNGYTYSPLDDEIGKRYIDFASSRGNIVKLYKPALGNRINSMMMQNFEFQNAKDTKEWIGLDNVLVEYSPEGRMISIMTKAHQAYGGWGVNSTQHTNIYFGSANAQFIENRLSNNEFEDNFLRVATQAPVTKMAEVVSLESPTATPSTSVTRVAEMITFNTSPAAASSTPEHRIQLLKNLNELRKSGVLNEQEFQSEKKKVLNN